MSNLLALIISGLVFVLIWSVWSFITSVVPASAPVMLNWIVLLIAALAAAIAYIKTPKR